MVIPRPTPGPMLVAFARKARLLANRSSFKYKWNSGMPPGPRDRLNFQKLDGGSGLGEWL